MESSVILTFVMYSLTIATYLAIGVLFADIGWALFKAMASYSALYRSWNRLHERNVRAFRILVTLAWPLILVSGVIWLVFIVIPGMFFRFILNKPSARELEELAAKEAEAAEERRREIEYDRPRRWWPFLGRLRNML